MPSINAPTGKESSCDAVSSSAEVTAFLSVPTSCGDKGLGSVLKHGSVYQSSSSGNSSPSHDDVDDFQRPSAPGADDAGGFHVDDIEMWEVLEALDVPAPASETNAQGVLMPVAFSPPHATAKLSRPAAGVSPVKSSGTKKTTGATKRPLPASSAAPAAAALADAAQGDLDGLGLEPLEPLDPRLEEVDMEYEAGEGTGEADDPTEEKRLKRMRRNRESAAMSRNRKKAYIEELEAKVAALTSSVQTLQSENWTLKQECAVYKARSTDDPPPSADALPEALHSGSSSDVAPEDLGLLLEPPAADDLSAGLPALPAPAPSGGAAPAGGAQGKKAGTAGLAMMAALTFVAFSANSGGAPWARDAAPHSPTARALMSFPDEHSLPLPAERAPRFGADEPLWPAVEQEGVRFEPAEPRVSALPLPVRAPAPAGLGAPEAAKDEGRALLLPRNSSWADALRVEAAEKHAAAQRAAEGQLMVGGGGGVRERVLLTPPEPRYLHAPAADPVYEAAFPDDEYEEGEVGTLPNLLPDEFDFSPEAEAARRFIFCARAYSFDVTASAAQAAADARRRRAASPPVSAPPPSRELDLPAMPARFRHAASAPLLTDGSVHHAGGNESEALPLPTARYPIVSMLLPSATLRGVVTEGEHPYEGVGEADAMGGELMQVSCQVLNASRWGGA